MKTIEKNKVRDKPRWLYDCGYCCLSWNCGPSCQCGNSSFPSRPEGLKSNWPSQWHNIRIANPNIPIWKSKNHGYSIAEIKSKGHKLDFEDHESFEVDEKIEFRVGKRNEENIMVPQTRWSKGVIVGKTNRWHGITWGFYIYTIDLIEPLKKV